MNWKFVNILCIYLGITKLKLIKILSKTSLLCVSLSLYSYSYSEFTGQNGYRRRIYEEFMKYWNQNKNRKRLTSHRYIIKIIMPGNFMLLDHKFRWMFAARKAHQPFKAHWHTWQYKKATNAWRARVTNEVWCWHPTK